MSRNYEFEPPGKPSSVQIELIGGPGDGFFAPVQRTMVVTPPLKGDPEDALGHGYRYCEEPARYEYIGLVYKDDIEGEEGEDE